MPARIEDVGGLGLECRELGHLWRLSLHHDTNLTERGRRVVEFTRHVECGRCGAKRKQVIEVPSFRVKSTTITYPDGYLLTGARASKPLVRQEVLRRILGRRA